MKSVLSSKYIRVKSFLGLMVPEGQDADVYGGVEGQGKPLTLLLTHWFSIRGNAVPPQGYLAMCADIFGCHK